MRTYLFMLLLNLLNCISATNNYEDDIVIRNTKPASEIYLNYQKSNEGNKEHHEPNYKARSTDAIKFQDDALDLFINPKNENKDITFPSTDSETDIKSNMQNKLVFSNHNDQAHSPERYFKNTIHKDNFKEPLISLYSIDQAQADIRLNGYIKFKNKDATTPILFDNYQSAESIQKETDNLEGTSNNFGRINDEDISSKRVVFEDNEKHDYRSPDVSSISGRIPPNSNFQYTNTGSLSSTNQLPKDPHSYYQDYPVRQYGAVFQQNLPISTNLGFPEQNNQVTHTGTKLPSQKYPGTVFQRPGLYPASGVAGQTYGYNYAGAYQGQYRPPIQPINLAQRAISAVTNALTSIALYDDKQCVPRLLCEASTGTTAKNPTLLKATASLAPLLTILQTYNGISSSPLFIFGRAAFLGATSKGNPSTCRYAYPQCPNDPDKLINYLNNHNGGFFRFFGQPQKQQQQNLEQFYNQLSGQYGYSQQKGQQQINYGEPYSFENPYNPYEQKSQNINKIDNENTAFDTEERIQNKPAISNLDDETNEEVSKWIFPDEMSYENGDYRRERENKRKAKRIKTENERGTNTLKFPDEIETVNNIIDSYADRDCFRKPNAVYFPDRNNFNYQTNYESTTPVSLEEYIYDYKHKFFIKKHKNTESNEGIQTLYVVRGNGDPRHPEIVKVIPGQRA